MKETFPDIDGFSPRNLDYMRQFSKTYANFKEIKDLITKVSWSHNLVLMSKIKDINERMWYIDNSVEYGWSRTMLIHHIETNLYDRSTKERKVHNFKKSLPSPQSDLAQQMLKDPYNFGFLTLAKKYKEKDLEEQLVHHITNFLLELGTGFAFVGKQYPLEIGGDDYHIDLLFYHLKLRCYIVIELKADKFMPEYAGKLNFYLSAVDDLVKEDYDNPTIGILLCATKDDVKAEYALKDINKPIGISQYDLSKAIPEDLKSSLPTIEEIESEIEEKFL